MEPEALKFEELTLEPGIHFGSDMGWTQGGHPRVPLGVSASDDQGGIYDLPSSAL